MSGDKGTPRSLLQFTDDLVILFIRQMQLIEQFGENGIDLGLYTNT